jgi:hypothetical protein
MYSLKPRKKSLKGFRELPTNTLGLTNTENTRRLTPACIHTHGKPETYSLKACDVSIISLESPRRFQ